MPFFSGALPMDQLIELIADTLVGYANWENGDTEWVTTDTGARDNLARRCLKYTGDAADIWIALELINDTAGHDIHSDSGNYHGNGLRVTFSASWDGIAHGYPSTAPEESQSYIPYESVTDGGSIHVDLRDLLMTYYLWVDSSGFALMAVPEANSDDNRQSSFICVVEHMASKEYSDGLTNFYCFNQFNVGTGWANASAGAVGYRHREIVRPFAYQHLTGGIQFWSDQWYALKSTGNGKVYFVKPVICNDSAEYQPIWQSELFFKFSPESGLVDGDVIAVEGQTTKYICKSLASPDSTSTLYYAIKYVA